MPVIVHNLQRSVSVNIHRLLHAADFFLSCLRLQKFDVGVACEETDVVRELNRKYRRENIATDVLSFPQKEVVVPGIMPDSEPWDTSLGDIVLAIPYVQQQCREENTSLDERLPILICHSLCHLIGYQHNNRHNWCQMVSKERSLLLCYNNAFGACLEPLTQCEED